MYVVKIEARVHPGPTKIEKTRKVKHSHKLENYCTAWMTATAYHIDGRSEVLLSAHKPSVRG